MDNRSAPAQSISMYSASRQAGRRKKESQKKNPLTLRVFPMARKLPNYTLGGHCSYSFAALQRTISHFFLPIKGPALPLLCFLFFFSIIHTLFIPIHSQLQHLSSGFRLRSSIFSLQQSTYLFPKSTASQPSFSRFTDSRRTETQRRQRNPPPAPRTPPRSQCGHHI